MAIENTYLLGKNITLGCGFDLQAKAPLDSRQTVPTFEGLRALIIGDAAYEGMIVYDEGTKKTYQAQKCESYSVEVDGKTKTYDIAFREFGLTDEELKALIASETTAAMEFKGATATLPENPAKGDMWKVTASFEVAGETTKTGDSIVYNGEEWFRIPSGDDIEDTWRPVTGVDNNSTLTFAAGNKLDVEVATNGTVTYSHEAIDAPELLAENEQTRTYITEVETDGFGHITGYKTATENVVDTNTTYEFEGIPMAEDENGNETAPSSVYFQVTSSEEGAAAEVVYVDAYTRNEADAELAKKVDKVEGYSLVSDTEIARLADVDNYDDEEVRGLIGDNADAIDALSEYVGTIPSVPGEDGNNKYADLDVIGYINKKAQETLAAASGNSSETAASVKGQLDDYIGENNTRVKAIEDDVAALEEASATHATKDELNEVDAKFADYNTTEAQKAIDDAQDAEIAKKVNKTDYEADKATFATKTELGDVDKKFADYKTAVDQKVIDDAQDVEIAKKVDKVDGKDLIATSEIERLATLKNYDDTALAGRVAGLETESANHALKTELEAVDKKFEDYTKTSDLPTDLGDFTNEAGYAKTADVNTDLDKKADKTQVATDIANAIAPLATTEALNGVDAKFDNYTNTTDMNAKFDLKADKTQVATDIANAIAPLATTEALNGVKATAEAAAVATEVEAALALKADITYVDGEIDKLEETIGKLNHFEAKVVDSIDEVTETGVLYLIKDTTAKGADVYNEYIVIGGEATLIGDTTTDLSNYYNKTEIDDEVAEIYFTLREEMGQDKESVIDSLNEEVSELTKAIATAQGAAEAKAAELDAALKTELQAEIDADVKVVSDALATAKTELNTAIADAKTDASNKDAVVLAEAQKYADQAKADAIADAKGKVDALADNIYTKEQTYTQAEVNALLTWGSF